MIAYMNNDTRIIQCSKGLGGKVWNRKQRISIFDETADVCVYYLDDEFDELLRDMEMEATGYAVICAEKDPTSRNRMVVAAVRGVTGKQMVHGAGSCHKPGHPIQHNEGA